MPFAIILIALLVFSTSARAEMFDKDNHPCSDQQTTIGIVECTNAKTKVWDQLLNDAYKSLGLVIDPAQRDPLKAAQRLWIQYRDANCKFYAAHDGTISQVMAAECVRAMTQARAIELEAAAKP